MIKEKIMRTLSTRTWNPLNFFNDTFENFFTPYYEKFDFMKTDITEKDEAYLLEVELPGFDKKDITVEYQNKYLTIKAERSDATNEKDKVIRYVHLGTGNYNDKTAKFYVDMSLFTCNQDIANDTTLFFNVISGYSVIQPMKKLVMAP